jgi:glycosyltransferase involved in cell wall biosynthesis
MLQAVTAGRIWDEAKNLRVLEDLDLPMPVLIAGESRLESAMYNPRNERVRLLGSLDEPHLLDFFRRSWIYACTSIYEPFGLAPLEAALCGCAVVANDIPPLREVWADGALFFSGAESFAQLLSRLCHDREFLIGAQQRSMRRARGFTRKRMASEYQKLFEETLQHRLPASHVA